MEFIPDPKPLLTTLPGPHSSTHRGPDLELNRRRLLKLAVSSIVGAQLPGWPLHAQSAAQSCSPLIPKNRAPSNGGPCPYPIPWLDKNGNHNQSPMPGVELSNIYHFKGKLARCNGFRGIGTDNKGATASPGALRPPTSATWRANTGRHARRTKLSSPTHDSPYSGDRRSHKTRYTIFIRPSRRKVCTGSLLYRQAASASVRPKKWLRSKCPTCPSLTSPAGRRWTLKRLRHLWISSWSSRPLTSQSSTKTRCGSVGSRASKQPHSWKPPSACLRSDSPSKPIRWKTPSAISQWWEAK